jgi:putative nucleotidyltransferase with HDIG domain
MSMFPFRRLRDTVSGSGSAQNDSHSELPDTNHVDRIVKSIDYLPPFPMVVTRALNLMRDPDVNMNDIAEVISTDQSIVANLLRYCNCSFIALQRPIRNVHDAVVFVGLNYIRKMLVISGARTFYKAFHQGYETQACELWHHSLAASFLAARIEKLSPGADSEYVFISALLHDVGKIVLYEYLEKENRNVRELIERQRMTPVEAEKQAIGIDHAEIGFRILSFWQFPDEILEAVSLHHQPVRLTDSRLSQIVRLANGVAKVMGYGIDLDGLEQARLEKIAQECGINMGSLDLIAEEMSDHIEDIVSELGLTVQ